MSGRGTVRGLGRLLLGVAIGISLVRLALDAPPVRLRLCRWAAGVLAAASGGPVILAGLDGRLPLQGSLSRAVLADADGPWLEAEDIRWQAAWPDSLRGPWRIRSLAVARVRLLRLPAYAPATSPRRKRLDLPMFAVESLRLESFLSPPVNGLPAWSTNAAVAGCVLGDAWGLATSLTLVFAPADGQRETAAAASTRGEAARGLHVLPVTDGRAGLHVAAGLLPDWRAGLHVVPWNLGCRAAGETLLPHRLDVALPSVRPLRRAEVRLAAAWRGWPLDAAGNFAWPAGAGLAGTNVVIRLPGLAVDGAFHWQGAAWQAGGSVALDESPVPGQFPWLVPVRVGTLRAALSAAGDGEGLEAAATFEAAACSSPWATAARVRGAAAWPRSGALTVCAEAAACSSVWAQASAVTGRLYRSAAGLLDVEGAVAGGSSRWGDVAGVTNLRLRVTGAGGEPAVSLAADLHGVRTAWARAGRATVSATVRPEGADPLAWTVEGTCGVEAGAAGGASVATARATLSGSRGVWRSVGHAGGMTHAGLPGREVRTAAWTAAAERTPDGGWHLAAERLDVVAGGASLRLAGPATLDLATRAVAWRDVAIEAGGARVRSEGRVWGDGVAAWVDVTNLPAAWVWPLPAGVEAPPLAARLEVGGSPAQPRLAATAALCGLRLHHADGAPLPPLDLRLEAACDGGRASAMLTAVGWPLRELRATAEAPLALSLRPWRGPSAGLLDGPWRAGVQARFNVEELRSLVGFGGVDARGAVDVDLAVEGPRAAPRVSGTATLRDGYVEHAPTGTLLRDLRLTAVGEGARLELREGSAGDGDGGELLFGGGLGLGVAGVPLALHARTKGFTLWRRGASRLAVKGDAALTGPLADPCVTGQLQVVDSAIRIDRARPQTATLAVEGLGEDEPVFRADPARRPARLRLDLAVTTKRPLPVEGRGLQSRWDVRLHVGGPAQAPEITGEVAMREGRLHFLGHAFTLADTRLELDGAWPPDPRLYAAAEARTGGMTARLRASGRVSRPALDLTSTPDYAREEIVSRLLFGRGSEAISPFQAARLAYGLEVLRGGRHALELLDRGQALLGIDELEFEQDEETGRAAVVAGRRLGSRLYLRGEKGVGAAEDTVAVQAELLPSLILESETRSGLRQGVSLRWRREF